LAAVFGTPNNVVAEIENRLIAGCPSFVVHTDNYTSVPYLMRAETPFIPRVNSMGFLAGRS
jgi:hypothetical protein